MISTVLDMTFLRSSIAKICTLLLKGKCCSMLLLLKTHSFINYKDKVYIVSMIANSVLPETTAINDFMLKVLDCLLWTAMTKTIWFHPVTYGRRHDCFRFRKHPSSSYCIYNCRHYNWFPLIKDKRECRKEP